MSRILSCAVILFVSLYMSISPDAHTTLSLADEETSGARSRAAAKRPANLDVGEPRTVRLIYFLPSDRPYRANVLHAMKIVIRHIQTFYSEQVQVHGYGENSFRYETDAHGEPQVHLVNGQHPDIHYLDDTKGTVFEEIGRVFDLRANIYVIVVDNSNELTNRRARGSGARHDKVSGYAMVTGGTVLRASESASISLYSGESLFYVVLHELGHAFGLHHDFRDGAYIMSYGPPGWNRLSECHARYLSVHPYFNPNSALQETRPPTIELLSPQAPGRRTNASVRIKVGDSDGVHQVLLTNSGSNRRACRGIDGKKDAVVKFNYFDVIPPDGVTSLSNPVAHRIAVNAVDLNGNVRKASFVLDVSGWLRPQLDTLKITSGDDQQGSVGLPLVEPLAVLVLDQNGTAVSGVAVTFMVTTGGGTLSVKRAFTDVNGRAETMLTLGRQSGQIKVEAAVLGLEPVTFSVTGLAVPRTVTGPLGDQQEGPAGFALNEPFIVEVRDQNGNPLAGATVNFTVTAGGGTLSDTAATTDASGRASATLTLGSQPGTNTVVATVSELDPVTFTATGKAHPDFDSDGTVGFVDFVLFAEHFGPSLGDEGYDARFDLDGNGVIGFSDFVIFAGAFGKTTT